MALDDAEMAHNKIMHELERLAYVAECANWFMEVEQFPIDNYDISRTALSEWEHIQGAAYIALGDALDFSNSFKH
jgi:hypothetical protein